MNHSIPRLRHLTPRRRRAYQLQAEGLEERQLLNAGDLDLSFDSDGYALVGPTAARVLQIQGDGKLLVAGYTAPTGTSGWSA